jgi:hypothetical protein
MVMESMLGLAHRFSYNIAGHSGDPENFSFVDDGKMNAPERRLGLAPRPETYLSTSPLFRVQLGFNFARLLRHSVFAEFL